jgi:carbonic anhydrase
MSTLHYPSTHSYRLPEKNILVISCMDLRLTDNLVEFLHFDNLHNRYDHFILAGASLLCTHHHSDKFMEGILGRYEHWKLAVEDHIQLAIDLHDIKDIYIVEHQNCGAYTSFLDKNEVDLSTLENEREWHKRFAEELANEIKNKYHLNTHGFFIDLRGNVELMFTKPK